MTRSWAVRKDPRLEMDRKSNVERGDLSGEENEMIFLPSTKFSSLKSAARLITAHLTKRRLALRTSVQRLRRSRDVSSSSSTTTTVAGKQPLLQLWSESRRLMAEQQQQIILQVIVIANDQGKNKKLTLILTYRFPLIIPVYSEVTMCWERTRNDFNRIE